MAKKVPEPTQKPRERALLVGVSLRGQEYLLNMEDSLSELSLLAKTAGLDVVGQVTQKLDKPYVQTFIGPGKIDEVQALVEETLAEVILFDDELSPRHLRELETKFDRDIRILDRTALILDIFAQHASTNEGALQVELAQYEYRLPRLTRAWTHLARQAGGGAGRSGSVGGVGLRGPGETQLEVDRREIRKRIEHLKDQVEKVRHDRQQYRARRRRSQIPVVALVGYTNAGKSTLLNKIAGADVYVADQLFATLDPTTRRVSLPGGQHILMTDTVGFIQKLPATLVAAFRATLEEINEADLLLHVVDITHPNALAQAKSVHETLAEIHAETLPVITVLNKIDRMDKPEHAQQVLESFPQAAAVSALTGEGVPDLLKKIGEALFECYTNLSVKLPYKEGGLIALFHEQGQVDRLEHQQDGVLIHGRVPARLLVHFHPYKGKR